MSDGFCEDTIMLGISSDRLTCDRYADHDGPHGGVYPGDTDSGQTIDVRVEWSA